MTLTDLPTGAYLAWRYGDSHRSIDRAQIYWDDGRVEALEGGARDEVCRFDAAQVERARQAIVDSGLPAAAERSRGVTTYDTAAITYWWRLDTRVGQFLNSAYPVEQPVEIDRLEAALAELEEAAGGWPLSADE